MSKLGDQMVRNDLRRSIPAMNALTHDQRNILQIWVAWTVRPDTWQAVINGMSNDEIAILLFRLERAGAPAADIDAMADAAK